VSDSGPEEDRAPAGRGKWSWYHVLGILLFTVLIFQFDLDLIIDAIGAAEAKLVAVAFAFNFTLIGFRALRWQKLLAANGIAYGVGKSYLSYMVGILFGLFTPGRLGELFRAYDVHRECRVPLGQALPSVIADRLFDLIAVLLAGILATAAFTPVADVAIWLAVLAAVLLLGLAVLRHGVAASRIECFFQCRADGRAGKVFALAAETVRRFAEIDGPVLAVSALLTILALGNYFGQCYLLALAVGLDVGFFQVAGAVAIGTLVTLIPVSVGGIGTRDAAIVTYLAALGIAPTQALAFSIVMFGVFHVGGAVIGLACWWMKGWTRPAE
jgi:uncharacterized protein (TIRG00374 family)